MGSRFDLLLIRILCLGSVCRDGEVEGAFGIL